MTFATADDMTLRFGAQEMLALADRDGTGAVDAGVLELALTDADGEIVSVLGGAVTLVASAPPQNLKRLACDIARYRLSGQNPPEDVRKRYTDAVTFLRDVAAGKATLDGGAASPAAAAASPRPAATELQPRVFRRGLS
jgi:phage gp36-like protein